MTGIGTGIVRKAMAVRAIPMEEPLRLVETNPPWGVQEGPESKKPQGNQTQDLPRSSPSREGHGRARTLDPVTRVAPPASITVCGSTGTTSFIFNNSPNGGRVTTTYVPVSVYSSASPPSHHRDTNTNNKPLPDLPVETSGGVSTATTGLGSPGIQEDDPAPETDTAATGTTETDSDATLTATPTPSRDRRGTNGLSATLTATTTAAVPTITAAAASGRHRASSSSHPAADGSYQPVTPPRTHLPTKSSLRTGTGLGVGTGAGAGASILPSRTIYRHRSKGHAAMVPDPPQNSFSTRSSSTSAAFRRTGSVSSTSISASASGTSHFHRTGVMTSAEHLPPASSIEGSASASNLSASSNLLQIKPSVGPKPLIIRNGRTYIHDEQLPYPLPVDLAELHRQSLRTLLLFQLFNGPIISTAFTTKPPQRVLEVGCGSGFWSMMCHRFFTQHGHSGISFTGVDIVPLCGTGPDPNSKPDKDMNWRFIQHDMRRTPWPFHDGEFDLVMVKDMSSAAPGQFSQIFMDEYLRVLQPGGVLEIWETDMSMRMLRPHVPAGPAAASAAASVAEDSESESEDEDDATRLGVYVVSANTPLSAPLNQFLVEYNGWLSKALDKRYLSAVPCTMIGPMLLQEDGLMEVRSKRLAVPLSEVRWEREGVGGVVTKDGKSYIDSMKGKGKVNDSKAGKGGKALTAVQAAIRRTALETSVGLIQALEPMLRDVSGKSQDEWDGWAGKMMNDLLRDGGTSWGECLEIGAWSARRTKD